MALSTEGGLGLQDGLHQTPRHAETASSKPETAACDDERSIRTLGDKVLGSLAFGVGEQYGLIRVVDFDSLPLAIVKWQLYSKSGVLGEVRLASLGILLVGKHRIEYCADDLSGHCLAEPLLGIGDCIALDFGFELLHCIKELADTRCSVFAAGKLQSHGIRLHFACFLVGVFIDSPCQHEWSLQIERGIGGSIENADTLATSIVDLHFCVLDVRFGLEIDARND